MWCLCGAPALPARTTPLEEPPAAPPGSHAWLRAALADGRPAALASSSANTSRLHAALLSHAGDRLAPAELGRARSARTDGELLNSSIVMLQSYVDTCAPLGGAAAAERLSLIHI